MKVSLVTPMDIRCSYKATEYLVYEYAKFLLDSGISAEILITNTGKKYPLIKNHRWASERYKKVPKRGVRCKEIILPFKYHLFLYDGLPNESIVYLPFSIYDYIINILRKPKGQKYIIGCHGMHLKMGHIIKGHDILERMLNAWVRSILFIRRGEMKNLYCHAINKEQAEYMKRTFGFRPENIFYVPIMINAGDYRSKGNNSRKLRVVHIGGMGKDMQIVLDIVNKLSETGKLSMFEFYFIGERSTVAEDAYRKFGNIYFLGMIGDKDKFRALGEMDAMIVPAYETFSKTTLEGLASGLRILSSRRAASWKDVTDIGIELSVTENGYAEEYTRPLIKLAELKCKGKDINPHRKMNIRKTIENFDEKVILQKMLTLFLKVIDDESQGQ